MEFSEKLRLAIVDGVMPVLNDDDVDRWLEAVHTLSDVSRCLQTDAKDNLIRLMESVFSQANRITGQ